MKKRVDPFKSFADLKIAFPKIPDPMTEYNQPLIDSIRASMANVPEEGRAAYQQAIDELEKDADEDED